jgi:hypothetical protein
MDYRELTSRAWNTIWQHKSLIVLGILVALSSGGHVGASGGSQSLSRFDRAWNLRQVPDLPGEPGTPPQAFRLPSLPVALPWFLMGTVLIVGLAVWLVSTLARGALIAGASAVREGSETSLREAFATAWRKRWALLGIGALPAIPALILLFGAWGAFAVYTRLPPAIDGLNQVPVQSNASLILAALTCVALPFALALNILRTFANRACILEGRGVLASYGRGCGVLFDNIGPALLLLLIQVGIGVILALGLLLPALCCVFWPLLLVVQGTAAAFFSTTWTLAWRQWTALTP